MTLILSLITPAFAIQLSDRRLTYANGPKTGQVFDDDVNKLVCLCGNSCFGYTGIAKIGTLRTDDWLLDVLAKAKCTHPAQASKAIADNATEAFLKIRKDLRRQAFVGVGWSQFDQTEKLRPFICKISNALDEKGTWIATAKDKFSIKVNVLGDKAKFLASATGVQISPGKRNELTRSIRRALVKGVGPKVLMAILRDLIYRVARTDALVGTSLLCVCMPRQAVGTAQTGFLIVAAPPNDHQITFTYVNPVLGDFIHKGPSFVCGGGGWSNFVGYSGPRPRLDRFSPGKKDRIHR